MTDAGLVASDARAGSGTTGTDRRFGDLPYQGRWQLLLGPLHRSFNVVNRWFVVPAFEAGLAHYDLPCVRCSRVSHHVAPDHRFCAGALPSRASG